MKVPLSWLKEYIDLDESLEEIAGMLTMAGLEVEGVEVIGLPLPATGDRSERQEFKFNGLSWPADKFVVAQIDEVMPHPNADRLTLCRLNDGTQELVVLTGAPNLFPYKGQGPLAQPLKVAYAREGSRLYDGHQPGQALTTLKRAKIRGVDSFSMVCSEKELGISEEHEGVIILDADAPTGMPLADYMGDAVYEISILPNMIRNSCMLGVARELSAATGRPVRKPQRTLPSSGTLIEGAVTIQITIPELNPRFVLGLVRNAVPQPSPYWVQRRLRLAGMRPINSIVDATNYVMLEVGQPLHAFDYDTLIARAIGRSPTIITRPAAPGEKLTTLDRAERTLDDFTILVTDTAGPLSLAGVMGGQESEVTEATHNVLLEGASWNFINIRKTVTAQRLNSEAAYRFARGVHPALAEEGVQLGLDRIARWSGGQIAEGLVDVYPLKAVDPVVELTPAAVRRLLGIDLSPQEIAGLLEKLDFKCRVEGEKVLASTPPYRLDIGEGVVGQADLLEEIARTYGYNRLPATRLSVVLPAQKGNPSLEQEEHIKDILVGFGLQEVMTYRMTTPEREARLTQSGAPQPGTPYVRLLNPITPERNSMRRSLLSSVMEITERNFRLSERLALFEIGPVFQPRPGQELPDEPAKLAVVMTGLRQLSAWDTHPAAALDFYDLKGILEALLDELHIPEVGYAPADHPSYHPGKSSLLKSGETVLGVFGELHPLVERRLELGANPLLAAEIDLELLLPLIPSHYDLTPVPVFPPILEDIAIVVEEDLPAERVVEVIRQAGGKLLSGVRLFDIFRGGQLGPGKKSLAYSLTYQAPDRTLTDAEAAQVRQRIVRRLEQELGAKLRS
jgi:phenylalanyl-tRNA synthetase beta chain